MTQSDIQRWLTYWKNANIVAFDQITAFNDVRLARKYCSRLRTGVFSPDVVSDLQIWRALVALRKSEAEKMQTEV